MKPYTVEKRQRYIDDVHYQHHENRPWTKEILDLDEGSVFGRTPHGWCLLMIFYLIFYFILFGLFLSLRVLHSNSLPKNFPCILQEQPGMSFEPCEMNKGIMHLSFHEDIDHEIDPYIRKLDTFFDKFGPVPNNRFGNCTKESMYGYANRQPCIFIKVNRVIGFKTESYKKSDEMPDKVPTEVKTTLKNMSQQNLDGIGISCTSSNSDVKINFIPNAFIESKWVDIPNKITHNINTHDINKLFYSEDDWNRVIAAQLSEIPIGDEFILHCYMWAKNIVIKEDGKLGTGHIRLPIKIMAKETYATDK